MLAGLLFDELAERPLMSPIVWGAVLSILAAVTQVTFTSVNDPFPARETAFSACDRHFQGKFPMVNNHGYAKKIRRSAHDI